MSNGDRALVWLEAPTSGETLRLHGLEANHPYTVQWWNTVTGTIMSSATAASNTQGVVQLNVIGGANRGRGRQGVPGPGMIAGIAELLVITLGDIHDVSHPLLAPVLDVVTVSANPSDLELSLSYRTLSDLPPSRQSGSRCRSGRQHARDGPHNQLIGEASVVSGVAEGENGSVYADQPIALRIGGRGEAANGLD